MSELQVYKHLPVNIFQVFNEIDADGNGYITPEEVVTGFKKLGAAVNIDEAKAIVKAADTDGDGRVSYEGNNTLQWCPLRLSFSPHTQSLCLSILHINYYGFTLYLPFLVEFVKAMQDRPLM